MLVYLDPALKQEQTLLAIGLLIVVSGGVWFFRKKRLIASIVGFVILFLGMMMIPSTVGAHYYADQSNCINNLRQIDDVKIRWAADHHKEKTDVPTDSDLFGESLYLKIKPACPNGGVYILGKINENSKCSLAEEKGHKL